MHVFLIGGLYTLGLVIVLGIWKASPLGQKAAAQQKKIHSREYQESIRQANEYCTKHALEHFPGMPEHLAWIVGVHRTPGNYCDGREHRHGGPSIFVKP